MSSLPATSTITTLLGEGWGLLPTPIDRPETETWENFLGLQTETEDQVVEDPSDEKKSDNNKRVYKKRKSTHTIRKEEREALNAEIELLKTKLDVLKLIKSTRDGEVDTLLYRQATSNAMLRNIIQEHHLVVAKAQGMAAGYAQRYSYKIRPTEMYIHLTADPTVRHAMMNALRKPKLYYAGQFIKQRSQGLHPTSDYFNEERYETPDGSYCNVRFDRTSLVGATGGVRAVFEALKHAIFNAEIILSEASGNITIREDDELETIDNCSQMRLVTQTTSGVLVENNLLHFSEFVQTDENGNSYALSTADFVDEDDRFPYRPHERIRRDATAIVLVTSYNNNTSAKNTDPDYSGHTSEEEESEGVIVMTRWTFSRIRRSKLNVPTQVLRELRDMSGRVFSTVSARQRVCVNSQSLI